MSPNLRSGVCRARPSRAKHEACSCTIDEEVAPTADVEEGALLPLIVEARVGTGFAKVALHGNHWKHRVHFGQPRHCRVDRLPNPVPHRHFRAHWRSGGEGKALGDGVLRDSAMRVPDSSIGVAPTHGLIEQNLENLVRIE
jgi:hypothetical protein